MKVGAYGARSAVAGTRQTNSGCVATVAPQRCLRSAVTQPHADAKWYCSSRHRAKCQASCGHGYPLDPCGIVALIASAKNPPPGWIRIWMSGYLDIWISGYLDIWISVYLDIWISGYLDIWILVKTKMLLHPHSEILCGAAMPRAFSRKNKSLVFCNLKQCFFNSTWTIFKGTRLHGRGLKS